MMNCTAEANGARAALIDQAPSALALFDAQGRYVAASSGWLKAHGLERDATIGRLHREVVPRAPERWWHMFGRALAGTPTGAEDLASEGADGTMRTLRTELSCWHGADGEAGGVLASSIDVTALHEELATVRASEARYRPLVDHAPFGLFTTSESGNYVYANQHGADSLGYSPDEVLRLGIREVVSAEERHRIPTEIARFKLGGVVRSEWRFLRKDGSTFLGEVIAQQLPDGRLEAIMRDITQQRRAEDDLRESEFFHRQILELLPGLVFTMRPDGYCDYQNKHWHEHTGVPASQLAGAGWMSLLHPDDRTHAREAWEDAVAGRRAYDLECRIRDARGDYPWFHAIACPIRDPDGAIVRWFGVALNIEQQKQAQERLVREGHRMEALLDTVPAPVYAKDSALRYTLVNRSFCDSLKAPAAQFIGRTDEEVGPPAIAAASLTTDLQAISGQRVESCEQLVDDGTGDQRWISTFKSPFRDGSGRIVGLVGITFDITDSKNAEAIRIANLVRKRDALVREVHHRIKNHLQGVTGLLRTAALDNPALASPIDDAIARVRTFGATFGLQSKRADGKVRLLELAEAATINSFGPVQLAQVPGDSEYMLDPHDALPVALVLNELVTNAFKHRQPGLDPAPVSITLDERTSQAAGATVSISGGPSRLPAGFDLGARQGLGTGLELVETLLPGTHARLDFSQDGDQVTATLHFPGSHSGGAQWPSPG
jgi:PAS domain S-box-containing protein